MKQMLAALIRDEDVLIGNRAKIARFDDGTIYCRIEGSGIMSPSERPTVAGLSRILRWLDNEIASHPKTKT
jgi:hypothetical protein